MLATRNCQVGIFSEILEFLKVNSLEDGVLIFDSMSMRKGIKYDKRNDKYSGFVDLGGIAILNNGSRDDYLVVQQDVDDVCENLKNESAKKKRNLI